MNKIQMIFMFSWIMMFFILSILSMNLYHPIIIMSMLIFLNILINLNMSLWKSNFLYSIMLFLIMISGMLIIFLYFASLVSNEQNYLPFNKISMSSIIMNLSFLMFMILYFKILYTNYFPYNFKETYWFHKINEKSFSNISYFYEYPSNNLTIMCMFFLLISLFTIIKICSSKFSSLRKIK